MLPNLREPMRTDRQTEQNRKASISNFDAQNEMEKDCTGFIRTTQPRLRTVIGQAGDLRACSYVKILRG